MEPDQALNAHRVAHDDPYSTIYPPDLHSYSSAFMIPQGADRPRFHPSDAFGTAHRHEQHEAEHVFNSPQLTLDPSTLNLPSNSNQDRPSSANTSGSNSTTPTGSLRLSAYNQPNHLSSNGVTTRRKARAALEQLQMQMQVGVHADADAQPHHQHQQSDMQDVHMHTGEIQMHVDDHHDTGVNGHASSIGHEQGHGGTTPHPRHMYALLPGTNPQTGYYLNSNPDAFSHSPTTPTTPPDVSRDPSVQAASPSGLTPPTSSSTSIARAFRPGPLALGIGASRSMPLIPTPNHSSPVQQQLSPSHSQHSQLSSHPHMHPSPYYSLSHHNAASPGFPSTPTTSHHTQGSSSSSHSSGHTRYSVRGSPGPRGFGHGHARSSSFGTVSTMSVRSTSPANSVASAFTSLSGGAGGSAPASTSGPVGSPSSYGEPGDVQMPFAGPSPSEEGGPPPVSHHVRSQSHPPLAMPTAHPTMADYHTLLTTERQRHNLLQQGTGGYLTTSGELEPPQPPLMWPPHPQDYATPPPGLRMADEDYQTQFRPKPIITRAPHRKQKLANSDRKAICMYAKQHPNARQEDIAARYNVERSTISKILKNKEKWLGCPDDEAKVARKRKPRFDDLELVLKLWVEDTKDQGIVLSDALIRSKAKEEARELGISEDKFKASSGWLENFKHRVGIRKGKYVGRELWLAASDSEDDTPPLTEEQLHMQRIMYFTNPPPGAERAVKGFWRAPVAEIQRRQALRNEEQAALTSPSEPTSSPAEPGHPHTPGSVHPPEPEGAQVHVEQGQPQHEPQTTEPRSASQQHEGRPGGVGMRKTRSRTLAEARQAEAAMVSPGSSSVPTSPSTLTHVPAPGSDHGSGSSHHSFSRLSHQSPSSRSPPDIGLPDGRDVSAGLDAALDFIGCQPEGFATPEEVAVLQKLSRRMSRAEPPHLHHAPPGSSVWNAVVET